MTEKAMPVRKKVNFSALIEFFAFNTKLPEMAMLASKNFTAAKGKK